MKHRGITYILNLLQVSPTELSLHLHIDRSLISKWKSGTRKIDVDSMYFEKLLDYLMDRNEALQISSLENLFERVYFSNDFSPGSIRVYLKRFIIENEFFAPQVPAEVDNKNDVNITTTIYDGFEKTKIGIIDFLETAIKSQGCNNVYLIYSTVFQHFMMDDNYHEQWDKCIYKLLSLKKKIHVIMSFSHEYKYLSFFSKMLFDNNFNIYFYHAPSEKQENFSIHLIENKRVIWGFAKYEYKGLDYYAVAFEDPISVKAYTNMVLSIKSNCTPMFIEQNHNKVLYNKQLQNIYTVNKSQFNSYNCAYYTNPFPTYLAMSEELFFEVMETSNFSAEEKKNELLRFRRRKASFLKELEETSLLHFYSYEILCRLASQERVVYGTKNVITHPPLTLTNDQFKRHMRQLAELENQYNNFKICFILSSMAPKLPYMHCWCRKNSIICVFDNENPKKLLVSDNASFVNAVASTFQQFYIFSAEDMKTKEAVVKKLLDL